MPTKGYNIDVREVNNFTLFQRFKKYLITNEIKSFFVKSFCFQKEKRAFWPKLLGFLLSRSVKTVDFE
jgi:hypothetical protein